MKPVVNDVLADALRLTREVTENLMDPEMTQRQMEDTIESLEMIAKIVTVAKMLQYEIL
jgi:hypothetical protein